MAQVISLVNKYLIAFFKRASCIIKEDMPSQRLDFSARIRGLKNYTILIKKHLSGIFVTCFHTQSNCERKPISNSML